MRKMQPWHAMCSPHRLEATEALTRTSKLTPTLYHRGVGFLESPRALIRQHVACSPIATTSYVAQNEEFEGDRSMAREHLRLDLDDISWGCEVSSNRGKQLIPPDGVKDWLHSGRLRQRTRKAAQQGFFPH